MRISDWSSDVCSSDLLPQLLLSASALAVHRPAAGEKPVSAVAARARPGDPAFAADVLTGLSQPQKTVPARWFYDHRGRSEERRVGNECVSAGSSRGSAYH